MFLQIRSMSRGVKDLTFYSLTSMNIVNTVDLQCHDSTLGELHTEALGSGTDVT